MAEPLRWRRFCIVAMATTLTLAVGVYAFIAVVDPWDILPLSPGWQRAPMSTNQRLAYAALARSPKFDSLVLGTSATRLLRPQALNAALGGRFANLSMNSAAPHEQSRVLDVFRATHATIGTVIIGLDTRWCEEKVDRYFARTPLPEWMYEPDQWGNYAHIFSMNALLEANAQFLYLLGLRHARYTFDGYADFLPADDRFDAMHALARLGPPPPPSGRLEDDLRDAPALGLPALDTLAGMLAILPAGARKIVLLTPTYLGARPPPGSPQAAPLAACKYRITQAARRSPGTTVIDFMIDSPISRNPINYWDHVHYRVPVSERIVADLGAAVKHPDAPSSDFRILVGR